MARTLHRLTEQTIRGITSPGYHADGDGLFLQVSKSGSKSWIFRYSLNGRTRDMGLGPLKSVGLAAARVKASEARLLRDKGIDPLDARATAAPKSPVETNALTFRDYAEECIDGWAPDWKNPRTEKQWRSTLKRYAYPTIGDLPLAAIQRRHIFDILKPIWREKSDLATDLRAYLKRVLEAACDAELLLSNPADSRFLALGKKRAASPYASLPYRELPAFLVDLRSRDCVGALALEFAIMTAARSGEVRGARWPEVDVEARTWTVPGERMKGGRPHIVPLSDRALALIEEARPLRGLPNQFIFPGVKSGRPLSDMTLSALVHSMGYDCVPHGFRATFKTWAEETTSHANAVIEAALAHIVGDRTEATYMRGTWLEKRRALMDDWGAYCTSAPVETVAPMKIPA